MIFAIGTYTVTEANPKPVPPKPVPPNPSEGSTLQVTIKDASRQAIDGATVTLGNQQLTTDANGQCKFVKLTPGEYDITISKTGYMVYTTTITILKSNTNSINCVIIKKEEGSVKITVKDVNANAVADANVALNELYQTTNSAGQATFVNLAAGTYAVTISKNGYINYNVNVTIARGETKEVNCTLNLQEIPAAYLTCTDKNTGEILADVLVTLKDNVSNETKTAMTDAQGKASFVNLLLNNPYEITCNKSGYTGAWYGFTLTEARRSINTPVQMIPSS